MQHVYDARANTMIGEVLSIDDTGQAQTVTVQTSAGAIYTAEVVQSFGMSANPVVDGAEALLFAVGGDPANLRAILYNPSYRFGNQASGESTIFAPDGTRVSVRTGGVINIIGGNQITISAPNATITATSAMTVNAPSVTITATTVTINGELDIAGGPLKVNGVVVTVP